MLHAEKVERNAYAHGDLKVRLLADVVIVEEVHVGLGGLVVLLADGVVVAVDGLGVDEARGGALQTTAAGGNCEHRKRRHHGAVLCFYNVQGSKDVGAHHALGRTHVVIILIRPTRSERVAALGRCPTCAHSELLARVR